MPYENQPFVRFDSPETRVLRLYDLNRGEKMHERHHLLRAYGWAGATVPAAPITEPSEDKRTDEQRTEEAPP